MKKALLIVGAVALSACAPTQTPITQVNSSTSFNAVSFYPTETGLLWQYYPEAEVKNGVPYVVRNLGPSIFKSQAVIAQQLSGRGAETTWYRISDSRGVQTLGFRKPGLTATLEPPMLELPPQNSWRLGLQWEGQSKVTITDDAGKVQVKGLVQYKYNVQDQRTVTTPGGNFNVWVLTRQMTDDIGGVFPKTQQVWFAPYVGEVRTADGLLLTAKNFMRK